MEQNYFVRLFCGVKLSCGVKLFCGLNPSLKSILWNWNIFFLRLFCEIKLFCGVKLFWGVKLVCQIILLWSKTIWKIAAKSVTSNYTYWVTPTISFGFANLKLMRSEHQQLFQGVLYNYISALHAFSLSLKVTFAQKRLQFFIIICLREQNVRTLYTPKWIQFPACLWWKLPPTLKQSVQCENCHLWSVTCENCNDWGLAGWLVGWWWELQNCCAHPFLVNHCSNGHNQASANISRVFSPLQPFMVSWKYVSVSV